MSTLKNCPYCDSTVQDDNPVFVAMLLEKELEGQWYHAESDNARDTWAWPIGKVLGLSNSLSNNLVAEVVDKKVKATVDEFQDGYYYGGEELPQGTTFQTYVILKVGEHFYKKTGEGDSYSEIVWAGPVVPVKPKTVTKVVYSFE